MAKGGPTKRAVALRYRQTEQAPTVIAKGTEEIAEQIIELANSSQIPIYEDASLVEVLSELELNDAIPVELYDVVAHVLRFVYEMDQQLKEERFHE